MKPETLPHRQHRGTCCSLMKPKPKLRIGGLPLPGFPVAPDDLSRYAKGLLGNPSFKIMGEMPGPDSELMTLRKPEQVDKIIAAGGEINICAAILPLVN